MTKIYAVVKTDIKAIDWNDNEVTVAEEGSVVRLLDVLSETAWLQVEDWEFEVVTAPKNIGRMFRYNDAEAVLEWIQDWKFDDNYEVVKLPKGEYSVVDSIGLSRENAEADLEGYIFGWNIELDMQF